MHKFYDYKVRNPEIFSGPVSDKVTTTKEFLRKIEKHFTENDNSEIITLLINLVSPKYKDKVRVNFLIG